jgi:hypothetical protein
MVAALPRAGLPSSFSAGLAIWRSSRLDFGDGRAAHPSAWALEFDLREPHAAAEAPAMHHHPRSRAAARQQNSLGHGRSIRLRLLQNDSDFTVGTDIPEVSFPVDVEFHGQLVTLGE